MEAVERIQRKLDGPNAAAAAAVVTGMMIGMNMIELGDIRIVYVVLI